ncbi:AraC family transcriptional regulator [Flectobacillus longus]
MEGIGNIVGFKSKSVFYKEFKYQTGYTPLKYFEQFLNKEIPEE